MNKIKRYAPGVFCALLIMDAIFGALAYRQRVLNQDLIDAIITKKPLAVVTRLLDSGAHANTITYTPAMFYDENDYRSGEQTPLGLAVERGDLPLAQTLLEHGANPQTPSYVPDGDGGGYCGLLSIAAQNDRLAMARFLLDKGLSLERWNGSAGPALESARSAAMRTLFLDHGANVNARDINGWTPLMLADDAATARLLLQRGADVNARNQNGGDTALLRAQDEAVIRVLLEHGADPNAQDYQGRAALLSARDLETTQYNQDAAALREKSKAIMQCLLQYGADPNVKDDQGKSAMAKVKEFGLTRFVKPAKRKSETSR